MNSARLSESKRATSDHGSFAARLWDFVGSMRFAVSILTIVAIASAIGTIIKQNESKLNYVDKFGEFWAGVFAALGMHDVYNQAWFLVMLVFLLASTSICLIRNTPKMLHDMRAYKLHNRTNSLRHMPEHAQWHSPLNTHELTTRVAQLFERMGYQARASQDSGDGQTHVYFAAKRGRYNRLGYILTHLAIVVICLGGLLDSELSIRAQVLFMGKKPLTNMVAYPQVPASGLLSNSTLSYRGAVRISEGRSVDFVELTYDQNSYLLQDLPFWVRLDKFNVEYYSTGMPKLFASDVTIKDKTTGEEFSQTISVNHPLRYKGVALYQANFDANDSIMHLKVHPLFGAQTVSKNIDAQVGGQSEFPFGTKKYKLEWRGFKPINVFPTNENAKGSTTEAFTHAMNPKGETKQFQNFGASVTYVLRDDAGNAVEYVQYASPVILDDAPVFITARRDSLEQDYQYFRIPADADVGLADFMRLRAALADEGARMKIAQRYAQSHPTAGVSAQQMTQGIERTLTTFATGGLQGLGQQIESTVPEAERDKIATSLVRVLEETLWDGLQMVRAQENLPARTLDEQHQKFIRMSLYSLSEFQRFGSPVLVELSGMDIKQASGLQATRSPGQWWVYLGSVMLVLGTLAMAFIRERRIWLHITPNEAGENTVTMAMSSTRRTFDYQQHWAQMKQAMQTETSS
ncbi:MAG: ccsB [Burkholderiaceae bacterium]|nr:ccsB [Burkholderiaceae bacterium]